MLDLRANHGDYVVDALLHRMQLATPLSFAHHAPDLATVLERLLAHRTDRSLVRPDRSLVAMEKVIPDLAVLNLAGSRIEAVGRAAIGISAKICLHAEKPVVALVGG